MITTPKVTVLLSVHNGEAGLDRTMRSLFEQTYQSFSVICIDDASTDQTPLLLAQWHEKLQGRLKIIRNDVNMGLTWSLNRGLAAITTLYTARIDADDWWHKEKLAQQIKFLESNPDYGLVGCCYSNKSPKSKKEFFMPQTDDAIRRSILKRNPFAHSCVIFSTALVQEVGGYDESVRYGQDYDLWFRLLPLTKCYNVPHVLCYRSVGQGISVEKQKEQMRQSLKTQMKYIQRYHWPLKSYGAMVEPLLVMLIPNMVKNLKRKWFG